MPDVKERIMSNRKYIKSLLLGMSVMMTILIAIQIYITVYVLKQADCKDPSEWKVSPGL